MKTKLTLLILTITPAIAVAAEVPKTANEIFRNFAIGNLVGLIPVLILVAVVTLLVGIVKFVGAGDNEEKRQAGRQVMIYGIIVLFVMVSFWGFVDILQNSFFGKRYGIPNYLPSLQK